MGCGFGSSPIRFLNSMTDQARVDARAAARGLCPGGPGRRLSPAALEPPQRSGADQRLFSIPVAIALDPAIAPLLALAGVGGAGGPGDLRVCMPPSRMSAAGLVAVSAYPWRLPPACSSWQGECRACLMSSSDLPSCRCVRRAVLADLDADGGLGGVARGQETNVFREPRDDYGVLIGGNASPCSSICRPQSSAPGLGIFFFFFWCCMRLEALPATTAVAACVPLR